MNVIIYRDQEMKTRREKMSRPFQEYYPWDRVASDMLRMIKRDYEK